MRLFSLGIIGLDVCASVSYQPKTGTVIALLQGCCEDEQNEVRAQLASLSSLGSHPLLLPLVLVTLRREIIHQEGRELWVRLLDMETRSGQTGAPAIRDQLPTFENDDPQSSAANISDMDFQSLIRGVLGVLQRVTYAETQTNALLLTIEAMSRSVAAVSDATETPRKESITSAGAIISQRLQLLEQQTRVMLGDAKFLEKRAQAQQAAV